MKNRARPDSFLQKVEVRLRLFSRLLFCLTLFLVLASAAEAQKSGPSGSAPTQTGGAGDMGTGVGGSLEMNATGSVVVRVSGPNDTNLQEQVFVSLYKIGAGVPPRTELTSLDGSASFTNLPGFGWYTVEASAAGFHAQRKDFDYSDSVTFSEVDITLHAESAAAKLTYAPANTLPPKVRKAVTKGVLEVRAGNWKAAEKAFTEAYNAAPKSPVTNYVRGYLYLQMKDLPRAETFFNQTLALDPSHVPALVGLAHVRYQRGDLKGAAEELQKANTAEPQEWEAHWLLAEVEFRQGQFEAARDEAQRAVHLGKGAANGAEFIEGESLAELGQSAEGLKMLRAFLRDAPSDPNAPAARELAARLDLENVSAAAAASSAPRAVSATTNSANVASHTPESPAIVSAVSKPLPISLQSEPALSAATLPPMDWEPPGVDQEHPVLAEGVRCPADRVIAEASRRVSEFVSGLNNIEATDVVTQQQLSGLGVPVSTGERSFDYIIAIGPTASGFPVIDEYWNQSDLASSANFLGHMSMTGLADLPLIFHPALRGDFQFTCEGLGNWHSHAVWIVYFRQRVGRPARVRGYQDLRGAQYSAALAGRVWISAETFQIERVKAQLIHPLTRLGLESEMDVIEYGPVSFASKKTTLWLPENAQIYYLFRHHAYRRFQKFTRYKLFSVDASQKIGKPAPSNCDQRKWPYKDCSPPPAREGATAPRMKEQ